MMYRRACLLTTNALASFSTIQLHLQMRQHLSGSFAHTEERSEVVYGRTERSCTYLSGSCSANTFLLVWSRITLTLTKQPRSSFFDRNIDMMAVVVDMKSTTTRRMDKMLRLGSSRIEDSPREKGYGGRSSQPRIQPCAIFLPTTTTSINTLPNIATWNPRNPKILNPIDKFVKSQVADPNTCLRCHLFTL